MIPLDCYWQQGVSFCINSKSVIASFGNKIRIGRFYGILKITNNPMEELLMQKLTQLWKNLCAAWSSMVFLAMVGLYVLPDVLKTMLLCIGKESVSLSALYVADILGIVFCAGFSFLALCFAKKGHSVSAFAGGVLPCIAVICAGKILVTIFSARFGTAGVWISLAVVGLAFGNSLLLLGRTFGKREKDVRNAVITVAAGAVGYWIATLLAAPISRLLTGKHSWSGTVLSLFVVCAIRWLLTVPVIWFACAGRTADENRKKQVVPFAVSVVLLGIVAAMLFPKDKSFTKRMTDDYTVRINNACVQLVNGNILSAANEYQALEREIGIWKRVLENGWTDLYEEEIASNQMLAYLDVWTTYEDDRLGKMEQYYTKGYIEDTDFCFLLLKEYKKVGTLSPEQENRRMEILNGLAANGLYSGGLPDAEEISENADEFYEMIENVESYQPHFDYVPLLNELVLGTDYANDGYLIGVTQSIAREAVSAALEKPDDFVWNYLALLLYNEQRNQVVDWDNDSTDILTVAENFERDFEREFGERANEEQWIQMKKFVMRAYLRSIDFDKCADYGLETLEKYEDDTLRDSTLHALFSAGRYEECLALAKEAKKSTDPYPVYYTAAASLYTGDLDTSVEYALKLAEEVKTSEYPQTADELLYGYLALLSVDSQVTDARYDDLSEEQLKKLKSDKMLEAYLEAFYGTYTDATADSLDGALKAVDEVLSERDGLCYPHYLKGVAYSQQEMWDEAVEEYNKALDANGDDPMIWYALGNVYEELEDYENQYKALTLAVELNPWYDYYNDYEGTGIHMWFYRESALAELQRQHQKSQGVDE